MGILKDPITVADFIEMLSKFPRDWGVRVITPAGGGISIEHREVFGEPIVGVYGSNGGKFGENPLTEEEYRKRADLFLSELRMGYRYTSIHGDHRLYQCDWGPNATCYGTHYDSRIIERMVKEGLITADIVDLERVRGFDHSGANR